MAEHEQSTISIITPIRDGFPLIQREYRSIARQTFADWEWLVVDDGSTDGTPMRAAVVGRRRL